MFCVLKFSFKYCHYFVRGLYCRILHMKEYSHENIISYLTNLQKVNNELILLSYMIVSTSC